MARRAQRSFATDSLASFVLMLLTNLVRLPTNILIARFLGPAGKGVVTLLQLLLGQTALFLSLGLDAALVHFAGRRGRPVSELAGRALGLGLVLGGAGFVVLVALLVWVFGGLLPAEVRLVSLLLAATLPLTLIASFLRSLLRACGRVVEEWSLMLVSASALLAGVGAGLLIEGGLAGVLWGLLGGSVLTAVVTAGLAWRMGILRQKPEFDWNSSRELVGYGAKLHGGNILEAMNDRFDMYILAFFLGPAAVGIYSIAVVVAELVLLFPGVVGSVLMPRVATRSDEGANSLMAPVLRMTSFVLAAGAIALGFAGEQVIGLLFGGAFAAAFWPMVLLLPGSWALGVWRTIMSDLVVRGHPLGKTWTAAVAVVTTIGLDLLLIPRWGVPGAAVASSLAYSTATGLGLWFYCRVTRLRPLELLLLRREDFDRARSQLRAGLASWRTGLARGFQSRQDAA
jgi:O-antigen/teichoic acid export membrane protein